MEINNEINEIKGYLLLHNIGKNKNIGTLIRSACAFNLDKVFIISKDEIKKKAKLSKLRKEFGFFGSQGTDKLMNFDTFPSLKEAKEFFILNKIFVCGVEITKDSQSILKNPFKGSTVFIMGNEGQGLLDIHKQICDHFVYIPQYTNKTASLNVAIAGSIIFHHFAIWAGFKESEIFGEKFQEISIENNNEKIESDKIDKNIIEEIKKNE